LTGWHNAQLLSGGPNESNRANTDLFVDALLVLLVTVTITIKRGQIVSPVQKAEASSGQERAQAAGPNMDDCLELVSW
jgi:hypothetical protein